MRPCLQFCNVSSAEGFQSVRAVLSLCLLAPCRITPLFMWGSPTQENHPESSAQPHCRGASHRCFWLKKNHQRYRWRHSSCQYHFIVRSSLRIFWDLKNEKLWGFESISSCLRWSSSHIIFFQHLLFASYVISGWRRAWNLRQLRHHDLLHRIPKHIKNNCEANYVPLHPPPFSHIPPSIPTYWPNQINKKLTSQLPTATSIVGSTGVPQHPALEPSALRPSALARSPRR